MNDTLVLNDGFLLERHHSIAARYAVYVNLNACPRCGSGRIMRSGDALDSCFACGYCGPTIDGALVVPEEDDGNGSRRTYRRRCSTRQDKNAMHRLIDAGRSAHDARRLVLAGEFA